MLRHTTGLQDRVFMQNKNKNKKHAEAPGKTPKNLIIDQVYISLISPSEKNLIIQRK